MDSLPDELVLTILNHVPPQALLNLSLLCRRLHFIALPLYFKIHGIENPTEKAKVVMRDRGQDILTALQVALFIPSIAELSCILPSYDTIQPLRPHFRRLQRLLARLAFAHKVTLVLDSHISLCRVGSNDSVETWVSEFNTLLNTILKRGCSHLTVQYGSFFNKAYHFRPSRLGDKVFRNVVRHIISETPEDSWEALQLDANPDVSMELDAEGCLSSTLTHFRMESTIFLLPPCFSWSLSALKHSPITRLEFFGITLPTKVWSVVLPPIAAVVPTLAELTLSKIYGISGVDILHFLAKLTRLKRLSIGYTEYSKHVQSSCPDSAPIPKLHDLTHLSAPSTFVSHLLRKKSLPSLQFLCITPKTPILGSHGVRHIGRVSGTIVRRLQKYSLAPTVSLEIHHGRDADLKMEVDLAQPLGEDLIKSLRVITRLIVYSNVGVAISEYGTLARWIACFPALSHVSLHVRNDARNDDSWPFMDDARRAISERNPNVKSLELNGVLLSLENSSKSRETPPSITSI